MELHYCTIGGRDGRSSYFFKDSMAAQAVRDAQNDRAVRMGIKARYAVETVADEALSPDQIAKEVR